MSKEHAIDCWRCGEQSTLKTRSEFDGCCWACGAEIDLEDHLARAMDECDQLRAEVEALRNRSDLSCDRAYRNGMQRGYAFGSEGDDVGYQRSMALYCDGIHTAMAAKDDQP